MSPLELEAPVATLPAPQAPTVTLLHHVTGHGPNGSIGSIRRCQWKRCCCIFRKGACTWSAYFRHRQARPDQPVLVL